MQLPDRTDVLVVGAGPCGLAMGAYLAGRGVSHLVIDRLESRRQTSRAAAIQARTLEVLEPMGVSKELVRLGVQAPTFEVYADEDVLASVSFADLRTGYPYVLLLPQSTTESVLEAKLHSEGGTLIRGCEAVGLDLESTPGRADALVRCEGEVRKVSARYVIAADGSHSSVRKLLGIPFHPGTYEQSFVLGDVTLDRPLDPDALRLFLAEDGILLLAPFGGARYRMIGTMEDAPETVSADVLEAMLRQRAASRFRARITGVQWSSRFRVHHGVAASFRKHNVVLVGDAAHVHSPAGGQGMNNGIQDACALAAILVDALEQPGDQGQLFETYERERMARAREVVSFTDHITRALTIESRAGKFLRNEAIGLLASIPALRHLFARHLAELGDVNSGTAG